MQGASKKSSLGRFLGAEGHPNIAKNQGGVHDKGFLEDFLGDIQEPRDKKDIPGCRVAAKNRFFVNSWVPEVTPKLLKINEVCRVRVLGRGSG